MVKEYLLNKVNNTILYPIDKIVDDNLTDMSTILGSFIIRKVRGKFQRSITFTVGIKYKDIWMEEALYAILSKYNKLDNSSMLQISESIIKKNNDNTKLGSGLMYNLGPGTHNLKYRQWNILLNIQHESSPVSNRGVHVTRRYTIITYNLSPEFVKSFEKDMLDNKDIYNRINPKSPTIKLYKDYHDSDGTTYWEEFQIINKRSLDSIYLPHDQKELLISTIKNFMLSKDFHKKHGIPHNLKILLYGPAGTGKSSLVKAIASHWNMNIYECVGGKHGKYIPDALISSNTIDSGYKLYSISDVDKYPILINEPKIDKDGKSDDDKVSYKQTFGNMINALDGIMSGEDKIIIMTTNHIDKFSETFLRPGRVDLKLEISYVNNDMMRDYVKTFYDKELPDNFKLKLKEVTIADLQFDVVFLKLTYEEFIKKYIK